MISRKAAHKLCLFFMRNVAFRRSPDVCIGGARNPYLMRWHVIPRNLFFNIYLHNIVRDDDDRALHDHPWHSLGIMMMGEYQEHLPGNVSRIVRAGSVTFRKATHAHRLELIDGAEVWTLFITGPKIRSWGFHCPKGWVHWRKFTNPTDSSLIGAGCDD